MDGLSKETEASIYAYCFAIVRMAKNKGYTRAAAWSQLNETIEEEKPIFTYSTLSAYREEMSDFRSEKGGYAGFPKGYSERMSEDAKLGRAIIGVMRRAIREVYDTDRKNGKSEKKQKKVRGIARSVQESSVQTAERRYRECVDKTGYVPSDFMSYILLGCSESDVVEFRSKLWDEGYTFNMNEDLVWSVRKPETTEEKLKAYRAQVAEILKNIDDLLK